MLDILCGAGLLVGAFITLDYINSKKIAEFETNVKTDFRWCKCLKEEVYSKGYCVGGTLGPAALPKGLLSRRAEKRLLLTIEQYYPSVSDNYNGTGQKA